MVSGVRLSDGSPTQTYPNYFVTNRVFGFVFYMNLEAENAWNVLGRGYSPSFLLCVAKLSFCRTFFFSIYSANTFLPYSLQNSNLFSFSQRKGKWVRAFARFCPGVSAGTVWGWRRHLAVDVHALCLPQTQATEIFYFFSWHWRNVKWYDII